MKKINGLLGVLALIASTAISAGNQPGAFTVTVGDAYYHADPKRDIDNSNLPNIALAYDLTERWAIEALVGFLNTNQDKHAGGASVHGNLYTVDGIYRFTPYGHLEPYVIAGLGILRIKPNGSDAEHPGNINAGLGAQLFFDTVALRLEARDIYDTSGESRNDYMINLGVSFLFGGNHKVVSYKGEG